MSRVNELVSELASPSRDRRCAAIKLGYEIKFAQGAEIEDAKNAVSPLVQLLSDPDAGLRSDAIHALQYAHETGITLDSVLPAIAKAAIEDGVPDVRMTATKIIGFFLERKPELLQTLLKALQDENWMVISNAAAPLEDLIAKCKDRKTLENMRTGLSDAKATDQVNKIRTLLIIKISELDYPSLRLSKRGMEKLKNFGRKLKLSLAV